MRTQRYRQPLTIGLLDRKTELEPCLEPGQTPVQTVQSTRTMASG